MADDSFKNTALGIIVLGVVSSLIGTAIWTAIHPGPVQESGRPIAGSSSEAPKPTTPASETIHLPQPSVQSPPASIAPSKSQDLSNAKFNVKLSNGSSTPTV
jgi:hypothetical protein